MAFNPCCCISLRAGAILIASLEIILASIGAVLTALSLGAFALIYSSNANNSTLMMNITEMVADEHPAFEDQDPDTLMLLVGLVLVLTFVLCILQIVFGSCLMHGIRTQRVCLVKMYLIFKVLALAVGLILTGSSIALKEDASSVFTNVLGNVLSFYFIYVIYRLYQQMRNDSQHMPKPKYATVEHQSVNTMYG